VANKIQSRFQALARCLNLEGSPGPFVLTDQVIPVVPVSGCLDRLAFGLVTSGSNSVGTAFSEVQVAGVYRISVVWSEITAAAGARSSYVRIVVGPSASVFLALLDWLHGSAVGRDSLVLEWELNLPEGWRLYLEATASGVGNLEVVNAVVQAL